MNKKKSSDSEPEEEFKMGFGFRLHDYVHRKLPRIINSPHEKESLKWSHERDPEKNAKTRPPEDEQIQLHCLWAVEFYTPMHTEDLASAFVRLGWNNEEVFDSGKNPIAWMESLRTRQHGEGWNNLGVLIPPNSKNTMWFSRASRIKLPEHVEYATAHMFNHSPSITCIVIGFIFEEEYGQIYDRALRQDYKTYNRPLNRGWSIVTPELQKRDQIIRLAYRGLLIISRSEEHTSELQSH